MQFSVISHQYSVFRRASPEAFDQASKHSFDLSHILVCLKVASWRDQSKVTGQIEKILDLAGRAHCNIQETPKFCSAAAATPFRDVCRDRAASTSELRREPEALIGWKSMAHFVNGQSQPVTFLPDIQLTKVLHRGTPNLVSLTTDD